MMMEGQGESTVCKDQLQLFKGKRSKRPGQLSPQPLVMGSSPTITATTSSGGESGRNSDGRRGFASQLHLLSVEFAESTEEEEDMANCLMLLARGRTIKSPPQPVSMATTGKTMSGIDVHQCKTCNRCFPSFQALGGHRASHKKPKVVNKEDNNKGLMFGFGKEDVHRPFSNMNTTLSLQMAYKPVLGHNSKTKVHECSTCGAEFSSGQALGGHMRRHRTLNNVPTTTTMTPTMIVGTRIVRPESEDKSKKPRTVLQLDLNLPAPEDDHQRETKLSVASKQEKLLLFSASSLVDCHY